MENMYTDLDSLIGSTQCGSIRNFLPLRFYVKSILVILKPQKLPFWPIEQLWILNFRIFLTFPSVKFPKNWNSKTPKLLKWQFFTLWNQPNLISRKIRVAGIFLQFAHCAQGSFFVVAILSKFEIHLVVVRDERDFFAQLLYAKLCIKSTQ